VPFPPCKNGTSGLSKRRFHKVKTAFPHGKNGTFKNREEKKPRCRGFFLFTPL
jgi:hypothetical protein